MYMKFSTVKYAIRVISCDTTYLSCSCSSLFSAFHLILAKWTIWKNAAYCTEDEWQGTDNVNLDDCAEQCKAKGIYFMLSVNYQRCHCYTDKLKCKREVPDSNSITYSFPNGEVLVTFIVTYSMSS